MENLLFLGVPIIKHIRVSAGCLKTNKKKTWTLLENAVTLSFMEETFQNFLASMLFEYYQVVLLQEVTS